MELLEYQAPALFLYSQPPVVVFCLTLFVSVSIDEVCREACSLAALLYELAALEAPEEPMEFSNRVPDALEFSTEVLVTE